MILGPTHNQCFESILVRNATEKGPETRLDVSADQLATRLGREDAMDEKDDVGMRHGAVVKISGIPTGRGFIPHGTRR